MHAAGAACVEKPQHVAVCNALLDKAGCFSEQNSNPTGFLESNSASVCFR